MPYPTRQSGQSDTGSVPAYHNPTQQMQPPHAMPPQGAPPPYGAPPPPYGATPSYVPPRRPGDPDLSTIPPIVLPPGVDPIWVIVDALEDMGEHWRQQRATTRLKLAQFAILLVQIAGMSAAQNMTMLANRKRHLADEAQRAAAEAEAAEQAARDLADAGSMLHNGGEHRP
jgi:hypothetical protein